MNSEWKHTTCFSSNVHFTRTSSLQSATLLQNVEIKNKLKEIYLNEKIPNDTRISQISKNVNLTLDETKKWLLWFESVNNYVENVSKLDELNSKLISYEKKFKLMNNKFILKEAIINEPLTKKLKIKK